MGTAHIATTNLSQHPQLLQRDQNWVRQIFHCYLHCNWCSNLSFIVLWYLSRISHLKANGYRESIQKPSEEPLVSGIGYDANSAQLEGRDKLWLPVSKHIINAAKLSNRHLIYQRCNSASWLYEEDLKQIALKFCKGKKWYGNCQNCELW